MDYKQFRFCFQSMMSKMSLIVFVFYFHTIRRFKSNLFTLINLKYICEFFQYKTDKMNEAKLTCPFVDDSFGNKKSYMTEITKRK